MDRPDPGMFDSIVRSDDLEHRLGPVQNYMV